jgi:hypothetical protein
VIQGNKLSGNAREGLLRNPTTNIPLNLNNTEDKEDNGKESEGT